MPIGRQAGEAVTVTMQIKSHSVKNLLIIVFCALSSMSFSQSADVAGNYIFQAGSKEAHFIEYSLTLNPDGTFLFHAYENIKKGIPQEKNNYGRGKWKIEGKIVSFFTDKEELMNEKYTLDLSNSKASFITKPSRDKSDRVIKTALHFFESDIFWIERLRILKI